MNITSALIKELREKTNAGMMDCKKALEATNGDFQAAVEWLRKKGLASAAKKADRLASEGVVLILKEGNSATMVEVNSETDFVAKNEIFKSFVENLARCLNRSNLYNQMDQALTLSFSNGVTVEQAVKEIIAKIGENIVFRRFVRWNSPHLVETYLHGDGKIGVMVELQTDQPDHQ
ncbi:MAG: translation elongation factor Ts, partial [Bdellovibrionaceae bacterium]|nr:translation elongation factor Ts [Pseudobdellovibrionaceae bacterium]